MTLETLYQEFLLSAGVCTDTRREVRHSLFFALKGERFDGNRFVRDALQKGCRLAFTEKHELEEETRVVSVPSVLKLLQQLAHHHRMRVSPKVL
ncbi:MAG: UDP-N-acetylmuramoyl-tripeptide--D-alanyl-D-alanine ligase, partial [Bacteroidales bacterium]|nr:UDP-N-acetylmuramoyl-tripeptide--D-alanyl-D-alanine ligase [Bacteroidales bacterium]